MFKKNLALNDRLWLICYKNQNPNKRYQYLFLFLLEPYSIKRGIKNIYPTPEFLTSITKFLCLNKYEYVTVKIKVEFFNILMEFCG